jgi:dGTPase
VSFLPKEGDPDGYEGNAQSFRIITKLAIRREFQVGLNLTRATLNATLKYPNLQVENMQNRVKKWGAYRSEIEDYEHARGRHETELSGRTIEAQLMDWADDIAYSIHDTEDFYRAGLIPLERLSSAESERNKFLNYVFEHGKVAKEFPHLHPADMRDIFNAMVEYFRFIDEPYSGTFAQRARLRTFTAQQISLYLQGTRLRDPGQGSNDALQIDERYRVEVAILKELVWCYVINNPSLAGQQHGQRQVIRNLFNVFKDAVLDDNWTILPVRHQEDMEQLHREHGTDIPKKHRIRVAADAIAGMTDQQALRMHQRLLGVLPGSVLDPIVL